MKDSDIYWLAGLLEGEGCFSNGKKAPQLRLRVGMTDRDIIERAATIMGCKSIYTVVPKTPRKTYYEATIYGRTAASWMMTLYVLMGKRRQDIIYQSLRGWLTLRSKNKRGEGRRNPRWPSEGK